MALSKNQLKSSLEKTAAWYENSGIMLPNDGTWGIAERVLLTENNQTKQNTFDAFPAWTHHDKYSIIEQRRADCNMECAYMYLLMADALHDAKYRQKAETLLDYLFFRSGLLLRHEIPGHKIGEWQWSHIKWQPTVYWDDNSWMCALELLIAARYPELDKKYELQKFGLLLADNMCTEFLACFDDAYAPEKVPHLLGNLKLPHWGSLLVQALAVAESIRPNAKYAVAIDRYHRYLAKSVNQFTTSEFGYAVIGAAASWQVRHDSLSEEVLRLYGDKLLANMDMSTGNIAAQHYEAPVGTHLADTIYTLNWAVIALQELKHLLPAAAYGEAFEKLASLLLKIQDNSPEPYLYGCWRGMYDMQTSSWGGGDRFEGGANSIYSGWTNAPIPWVMANELLGRHLAALPSPAVK